MKGYELTIYPIPIPCAAQGRAGTETEPGKNKWEGAEEEDFSFIFSSHYLNLFLIGNKMI